MGQDIARKVSWFDGSRLPHEPRSIAHAHCSCVTRNNLSHFLFVYVWGNIQQTHRTRNSSTKQTIDSLLFCAKHRRSKNKKQTVFANTVQNSYSNLLFDVRSIVDEVATQKSIGLTSFGFESVKPAAAGVLRRWRNFAWNFNSWTNRIAHAVRRKEKFFVLFALYVSPAPPIHRISLRYILL